ncbi:hypothetical protein GCM10009631_02200 [Corynebacterium glaucum]
MARTNGFRAAEKQKRADESIGPGCHARRVAAQRAEEQRLRLVIGGVGDPNIGIRSSCREERTVARGAGGSFEADGATSAGYGVHVDADNLSRHIQALRLLGRAGRNVGGAGLQTVVHHHRADVLALGSGSGDQSE